MSSALHTAEIVHWIALAFMGVVYTIRLSWLLKFKAGKDRQKPGDQGNTTNGPAYYSLANVAMPWAMESTRNNIGFWISFVLFHLGVVAGIFLAIFSGLFRSFFEVPVVANVMLAVLGVAFLVGIYRILRRFGRAVLRLISSPDDYFAVITITVWQGTGVLAQAHIAGHMASETFLIVFLYTTAFFLAYVPFSKISHYLYYPFIRWYLGKTLGHRGSMRPVHN